MPHLTCIGSSESWAEAGAGGGRPSPPGGRASDHNAQQCDISGSMHQILDMHALRSLRRAALHLAQPAVVSRCSDRLGLLFGRLDGPVAIYLQGSIEHHLFALSGRVLQVTHWPLAHVKICFACRAARADDMYLGLPHVAVAAVHVDRQRPRRV